MAREMQMPYCFLFHSPCSFRSFLRNFLLTLASSSQLFKFMNLRTDVKFSNKTERNKLSEPEREKCFRKTFQIPLIADFQFQSFKRKYFMFVFCFLKRHTIFTKCVNWLGTSSINATSGSVLIMFIYSFINTFNN